MATKHGKGVAVLINGLLMSAYLNNADISRTCDTAEDTAFQDTFKSYIAGLHDGSISLSGMWDPAANATDATLSALLGLDTTIVSVLLEGATVGGRAKIAKVAQASYEQSAPVGDVVTAAAEMPADGGVWGGDVLLAGAVVTATGTGTSVNNGVATTDGWVANLHVTAVDGTPSIVFKLADSADDSSFADVSGGAFAAATGISAQQISSGTGTVRQYARAAYTLTGSTSLTAYLVLARR
jgi:hypothetical protein